MARVPFHEEDRERQTKNCHPCRRSKTWPKNRFAPTVRLACCRFCRFRRVRDAHFAWCLNRSSRTIARPHPRVDVQLARRHSSPAGESSSTPKSSTAARAVPSWTSSLAAPPKPNTQSKPSSTRSLLRDVVVVRIAWLPLGKPSTGDTHTKKKSMHEHKSLYGRLRRRGGVGWRVDPHGCPKPGICRMMSGALAVKKRMHAADAYGAGIRS